MESLNQIKLIGRVGLCHVQSYLENNIAKMSVVTTYTYQTEDGNHVIECTWFSVSGSENAFKTPMADIKKGDIVEVIGRMRAIRMTDNNGNDTTSYEVVAKEVTKLYDNETLNLQNKE